MYGNQTSIPTQTVLDSKLTLLFWIHLTGALFKNHSQLTLPDQFIYLFFRAAPFTYLVAYYRAGVMKYTLIVLNVLVIVPDLAVYGILRTEFASTPGINANPGSCSSTHSTSNT